jgi:hypothetical protein
MRRAALLIPVLAALVFAEAAPAHYGDRWFINAAGATRNIEGKYRLDIFRKCIPTADAHVIESDFGAASHDHFVCLITSEVTQRTCWATAHITGPEWYRTVLTSATGTSHYGGCGPRDIRKQRGF